MAGSRLISEAGAPTVWSCMPCMGLHGCSMVAVGRAAPGQCHTPDDPCILLCPLCAALALLKAAQDVCAADVQIVKQQCTAAHQSMCVLHVASCAAIVPLYPASDQLCGRGRGAGARPAPWTMFTVVPHSMLGCQLCFVRPYHLHLSAYPPRMHTNA